jgi:hypothetical protein
MIKITRWSSDVCECVIEFSWDDSVPEDQRTGRVKNYVKKCSAHKAINSDADRFRSALEENQRKNKAHAAILEKATNSLYELDQQSGQRQLKSGITLSWELSGNPPNRVMSLKYDGVDLTATQKNNFQTHLNSKFGAGKVKLA